MQRGQPKHICFYSNKDDWSKAFIEELGKTPWVSEFQFVCVDPAPNRPKLPPWLKQVPTLVIAGEAEPLINADVMNWLFARKMKEQPKQQQTQASVPSNNGGGGGGGSGEPMSWNDAEMGCGGAGYCYLDADTTAQGNGGATIPGNFTFYNGLSPPTGPGDRQSQQVVGGMSQSTGRTKKEQQFDAQMEQYMRARDSGVPKQVARQ